MPGGSRSLPLRPSLRFLKLEAASGPAPPCTAVWSPEVSSQPRPVRSPPGPGPAWTARA